MLIDCYRLDGLRRLLAQVWYFSLSVAYMKKAGGYIVLHTDTLGKAILGHLPYDEIHLTLDEYPEEIHPRFWAAGKFLALAREQAPCIHIDGDVFIKRADLRELLEAAVKSHDVVTQSRDAAQMYSLDAPLFETDREFAVSHHCLPDGRDSFNTGLLGFGNERVRRRITENYFGIVRHYSGKLGAILDRNTYLTPDLIAEQKMIEGFVRECGLSHYQLLRSPEDAVSLGYQHVYTVDKFNRLDSCKRTLELVSPEIYHDTALLCGEKTLREDKQ